MEFIQKVSDSRSRMYSRTIFLFSVASFLLLAVAVDARSVELDDKVEYNDDGLIDDELIDDELIDDEEYLSDFIEPDEIDYIISDLEQKYKSKKKPRKGRETSTKYPKRFVRNCQKWDLC